jgi:hypothetical protein
MQYQGHTNAPAQRLRLADWFALCFVPLWALTLLLQVLDVGSVVLGYATGAPIREANRVVRELVTQWGLVPVLALKSLAVGAWLALALGVWAVCAQRGWRVGTMACTLVVGSAAFYSAWVFWSNIAAVLGH